MQSEVEDNTQFKQLAAKYEQIHPNVKVIVTSVGGGTDYLSTLKTRMSAGDEPTIFSITGPSDVSQFGSKIADVADTKAAKLALPGTLDAVKDGKKVLGLPFNLEGYGFVYSKKIFRQAGIDANQLKTYPQLLAAVKKLNAEKKQLGIKGVFSLPGQETWVMTDHLGNALLLRISRAMLKHRSPVRNCHLRTRHNTNGCWILKQNTRPATSCRLTIHSRFHNTSVWAKSP